MLFNMAAMMSLHSRTIRQPRALRPAAWLGAAAIVMGLGAAPAAAQGGRFQNGEFTGIAADTQWGAVQLKVIIRGGALTDIQYLQFPYHRMRSEQISNEALPLLRAEAIQIQSARVHILSGATATSEGFQESLASTLAQAAKTPAT